VILLSFKWVWCGRL